MKNCAWCGKSIKSNPKKYIRPLDGAELYMHEECLEALKEQTWSKIYDNN